MLNLVFPVKNDGTFKIAFKSFIMLYYHQILNSIFSLTGFISVITGFAFLFGTDYLGCIDLSSCTSVFKWKKHYLWIILEEFAQKWRCMSSDQRGLQTVLIERKQDWIQ